jgi:hypothetical protein
MSEPEGALRASGRHSMSEPEGRPAGEPDDTRMSQRRRDEEGEPPG